MLNQKQREAAQAYQRALEAAEDAYQNAIRAAHLEYEISSYLAELAFEKTVGYRWLPYRKPTQ